MPRNFPHTLSLLLLALLAGPAVVAVATEPPTIDFNPMAEDPRIPEREVVYTYPPRSADLLLDALEQDEVELRLGAIAALLTMHDHEALEQMQLSDFADRMANLAADIEQRAAVRAAAVDALARLDRYEALGEALQRGGLTRHATLIADRALAEAGWSAAAGIWVRRLGDEDAGNSVRASALDSLAAVDAIGEVEQLCRDLLMQPGAAFEVRMAAAKALGATIPTEAPALARPLHDGDRVGQLLSVQLLDDAATTEARELLVQLIEEATAPVALRAAERLEAHAPDHLEPLHDALIERDDPGLRAIAAGSIVRHASDEVPGELGELLDDPVPQVRKTARRALWDWAHMANSDDRLEALRQWLEARLDEGGTWRQLEQWALLSGEIETLPAAESIADLIEHERFEVRRAVGWALRRLDDQATFPAMQQRLEDLVELLHEREDPEVDPRDRTGDDVSNRWLIEEAAALIQTLTLIGHDPVWPLCERIVRNKGDYNHLLPVRDNTVRHAAAWALGHLPEDHDRRSAIADMLEGRLGDESDDDPEDIRVRIFAAISLGRLDSDAHTATLEEYADHPGYHADLAWSCRWALEQITGEPVDPIPPREQAPTLFLRPPR